MKKNVPAQSTSRRTDAKVINSKIVKSKPVNLKTINLKPAASKDWRAATLAKVREIMRKADREIVEELKWAKASTPGGVPVFSRGGIICTGETYKSAVKLTFAKGATLKDPAGLFNSSLEGNARRAIDIREGEKINEPALKELIREAVALNLAGKSKTKVANKGKLLKKQPSQKK